MSRVLKRKYKDARKAFKIELRERCDANPALPVLIVETYTAWHYRRHLAQIWSMFGNPEYEAFRVDYMTNLMGKHLSGRSDIWRSLYFAEKDLCETYKPLIPETFAMGDAIRVAYASQKAREAE